MLNAEVHICMGSASNNWLRYRLRGWRAGVSETSERPLQRVLFTRRAGRNETLTTPGRRCKRRDRIAKAVDKDVVWLADELHSM